mmetsp:Transcript_74231/g.163904  ORF Transcript_74231/g.163904 Transcript_74231/m.163904 type:complete len:245 (-) Transcript_74231:184-918(-)
MAQVHDPKVATQIGLLRLCRNNQIAIDHSGNQEIDGFKQRDGWIQCAKNDAYQQVNAPARTSRTKAVIILILGLSLLLGLFFGVNGAKAQEFRQVDVAQQVQGMGRPLNHHPIHIEMRGFGQLIRQQVRKAQWSLSHFLAEVQEVVPHRCDQQHKDHLEPEVPSEQHLLGARGGTQGVAVVDDQQQHRRQEGEENGESHGGRQGCPQGIQESGHVDAIGDVGDGQADGNETCIQAKDTGIANDL